MMTTSRKILANRRNAKLSTGPKTAAGRSRSSQNARRHGLSAPISADAELSHEAQALALEITAETKCPDLRTQANLVADAQVDLMRVHKVKYQMLENIMRLANGSSVNPKQIDVATPNQSAPLDDAMGLIEGLARLDRYEQRARSRRKSAIRAFDHAREERLTIEGVADLAERSQKDA